jgi:multidrug efflux pump subunit AcrA (membrane-fusion protein)
MQLVARANIVGPAGEVTTGDVFEIDEASGADLLARGFAAEPNDVMPDDDQDAAELLRVVAAERDAALALANAAAADVVALQQQLAAAQTQIDDLTAKLTAAEKKGK